MSDIVERLRASWVAEAREAAIEIERLRAVLREQVDLHEEAADEIERLRDLLRQVDDAMLWGASWVRHGLKEAVIMALAQRSG